MLTTKTFSISGSAADSPPEDAGERELPVLDGSRAERRRRRRTGRFRN